MIDLRDLSRQPIVVAPMAGGPSTPELVVAAAAAGAFGFLAAGYKSAQAMAGEIAKVRNATDAPFGVNVFVPGRPTSDRAAVATYLASIGGDLALAVWDDDGWDAKIAELLRDPPAVVSFTFGCPSREAIAALQACDVAVIGTVTTREEARQAIAAGVDGLCAQGIEAGAHRGSFDNEIAVGADDALSMLDLVRGVSGFGQPVVAAGGIGTAEHVRAALAAGAVAVQCGTAFLRCDESGANATYKAALADERYSETTMTRAFSARFARGLVNAFVRDHRDAPAAYPEINNATRPMRAEAARIGDPERMSLWAGTAWRSARGGPAAEIVERLLAG